MGQRSEVYTDKLDIANGRRCYFFNVKENRKGDFFLNIVESINRFDNFERQEIMIYEEHLEEFQNKIESVAREIRNLRTEKDKL